MVAHVMIISQYIFSVKRRKLNDSEYLEEIHETVSMSSVQVHVQPSLGVFIFYFQLRTCVSSCLLQLV